MRTRWDSELDRLASAHTAGLASEPQPEPSSAGLGKGVSGFTIGPLPDFTKFSDIQKA